jgi:hypothetical protein
MVEFLRLVAGQPHSLASPVAELVEHFLALDPYSIDPHSWLPLHVSYRLPLSRELYICDDKIDTDAIATS